MTAIQPLSTRRDRNGRHDGNDPHDRPNDDHTQELAAELERIYCAAAELTLSQLRGLLDAFSQLVRAAAPDEPAASAIAATVADLGLGHLSVGAVEAVYQVAHDSGTGDALAFVTLKQLEELMGRIQDL